MSKVNIFASSQTWIEGEAVRQLHATADLAGMRACVGMPDLHPGKGSPNGAAFLCDFIHPNLVGTDNGCGVSLWTTDILVHKARADRLIARLDGLDRNWDGDIARWLIDRNIAPTAYDASLGTPGHGNHFIEIQQVVDIFNETLFNELGLSKDRLCLTVHSGSRGFGEAILYEYTAKYGAAGVTADSAEGQYYLGQNRHAVDWAMANRDLCAHRVLEALRTDGQRLLDICHNSVSLVTMEGCQCWLHRKGAAPSDCGVVMIPGSRGDLSFVVKPVAGRNDALYSLAHGAGRKFSRTDAHGKLANLYRDRDIRQNRWGGRVICGERPLLWEEAPECYKDIQTVIDDMVNLGLIEVIATVRPLVTFKTSEGAVIEERRERKTWQRERDMARQMKKKNH